MKNLVNTLKTNETSLTNIRKTVITVSSDILNELNTNGFNSYKQEEEVIHEQNRINRSNC